MGLTHNYENDKVSADLQSFTVINSNIVSSHIAAVQTNKVICYLIRAIYNNVCKNVYRPTPTLKFANLQLNRA